MNDSMIMFGGLPIDVVGVSNDVVSSMLLQHNGNTIMLNCWIVIRIWIARMFVVDFDFWFLILKIHILFLQHSDCVFTNAYRNTVPCRWCFDPMTTIGRCIDRVRLCVVSPQTSTVIAGRLLFLFFCFLKNKNQRKDFLVFLFVCLFEL